MKIGPETECTMPDPSAVNESWMLDELSRRSFLRWGAMAGTGVTLMAAGSPVAARGANAGKAGFDVREATVESLRARLVTGQLSAVELTRSYLRRIEAELSDRGQSGGPGDRGRARSGTDRERSSRCAAWHPGRPQGQRRHRRRMGTRFGSLALVGSPAPETPPPPRAYGQPARRDEGWKFQYQYRSVRKPRQ